MARSKQIASGNLRISFPPFPSFRKRQESSTTGTLRWMNASTVGENLPTVLPFL
jgi:hypothetical protein